MCVVGQIGEFFRVCASTLSRQYETYHAMLCDQVDFLVRKAILAEASPIFEDMLSLPQPTTSSTSTLDAPTVTLTETSRTLYYLLCFCYPVPNPEIHTTGDVFAVLEAARKYMMDYVASEVQSQFTKIAMRDPLRVYAIACSRGWEGEMRIAARASLSRPLEDGPDIAELERISAGAYLRLRAYHRACRKAAVSLHYCGLDNGKRVWLPRRSKRNVALEVESWWVEYMEAARQALNARPCGATVLSPEMAYRFLVDVVARLPLYDKTRVVFDLNGFTRDLAECVENAISKVQLEVK